MITTPWASTRGRRAIPRRQPDYLSMRFTFRRLMFARVGNDPAAAVDCRRCLPFFYRATHSPVGQSCNCYHGWRKWLIVIDVNCEICRDLTWRINSHGPYAGVPEQGCCRRAPPSVIIKSPHASVTELRRGEWRPPLSLPAGRVGAL